MNKKRLFTATSVALSILLTGCSARQQTSSTIETSVVKEDDKTKDTTKPSITFKADSVTVEAGSEYDAADNIKSVNDDTDGSLKKVDKDKVKDGEAYYVIDDSKVDLKTAGEYKVKVTAQDSSGNVASSYFTITVKEKDKEVSKEGEKKSSESKTESSNKSTATTKKSTNSSTSSSSTQSKQTTASTSQSNNTTVQEQPAQTTTHEHTWVYVEAEYKTITNTTPEVSVDEEVTEEKVRCRGCGALFDTDDEWSIHSQQYEAAGDNGHGSYEVLQVATGEKKHVVITEAQTKTTQQLISPAHYVCTTCGDWKS